MHIYKTEDDHECNRAKSINKCYWWWTKILRLQKWFVWQNIYDAWNEQNSKQSS